MSELRNKVAYITGGSKGIGFGIAKSMLEQGMKVAISSRSESSAEEAKGALGGHESILPVVSDVRDFNKEVEAVEQVINHFGQLDVVIANAGVGHFAPIQKMTLDQWNEVIDINLTGVFHTIKASIPHLPSNSYIITIASLAGTNFFPTAAAYNASKFGLVGFTQAVMLDLRHQGINVSTIMPGSVATYFNNHIPSEADAWKIQPEDIGKLVIDLLKMNPRTLPSKIEVRPSRPPRK